MKRKSYDTAQVHHLQNKGLFNTQIHTFDGGIAGITPPNNFLPAGLLTNITPELVKVITRKRTADLVIGARKKLASWEQQDAIIRNLEQLGETTPYSDFGNTSAVSLNPQFIYAGHYRFSSKAQVGNLATQQLAKANISNEAETYSAALETLAIDFNNFAFFGRANVSGSAYPVQGLFTNTSLAAYTAATSTTAAYTFDSVYKDIRDMIQEVISRAKGYATADSSIFLSIANNRAMYPSVVNQYGQSVIEVLKKSFPKLEIINSPECDTAYNGTNDVMYCRIENPEAANVQETAVLGFSEIAVSSARVVYENHTSQDISSGTLGTVIYKPYMISRKYFTA